MGDFNNSEPFPEVFWCERINKLNTAKQKDRLTSFPTCMLIVLEANIFQYNFLEGHNVWQNNHYWLWPNQSYWSPRVIGDCIDHNFEWAALGWLLTLALPRGLPLTSISSGIEQSTIGNPLDRVKSSKSLFGVKGLREMSFLTLSLPRGLPLTSTIVWHWTE